MKAQKIRTGIAEVIGVILTIIILAPFLLSCELCKKQRGHYHKPHYPAGTLGADFYQSEQCDT